MGYSTAAGKGNAVGDMTARERAILNNPRLLAAVKEVADAMKAGGELKWTPREELRRAERDGS